MGYDLHITRKDDWCDEGSDITAEEWLAVVAVDPELLPDGALKGDAPGPGGGPPAQRPNTAVFWCKPGDDDSSIYLWLDGGNVTAKNPDLDTVRKMWRIAELLGARLQGDDGEIYGATGEVIAAPAILVTPPAPPAAPPTPPASPAMALRRLAHYMSAMLRRFPFRSGAILMLTLLLGRLLANPVALAQSAIGAYPSAPPPPSVGAYPPTPGPPPKIGRPPAAGVPSALQPDAMDYCAKNPGACAAKPPDADTVLQDQSKQRIEEQKKGLQIQEMQQRGQPGK